MAVVRLGRSIPFVPRRKKAAAAMAPPPSTTAPKPEMPHPGARVEVFHHGAWVGATVLRGNPPGATSLRVVLAGVAITEGHASIPKCLVRPAAPSVDIGSFKNSEPIRLRSSLSSTMKTGSRGPGIGISRAALARWFDELKPIYPNAQLPWIRSH